MAVIKKKITGDFMREYYAVIRSTDHLAHYGVKGMKWGVRKAIERGDTEKLSKHYQKALKKAKRLNEKADVQRSKNEASYRLKSGAAGLIGGAALAGGTLGGHALARKNNMHYQAFGMAGPIPFHYDSETTHKWAAPLGGVIGAHGAYNIARGLAAKHRTTKKGNEMAKAKANVWQKEMAKAFKGTKYSKLPGAKEMNEDRFKPNTQSVQRQNASKIVNPPNTSKLSKKDQREVNKALNEWANTFEKHYQTGLSKGMTHEQAERYSNNYIAKHGFKSTGSNKRRR